MELQTANNNGQNPKTDQTSEPHAAESWFEEIDSTCSTPYVSAPSSPGRGSGPVNGGFYYSAPASPMHFALTASYPAVDHNINNGSSSAVALGFEFGSGSSGNGSMSSADELFLDGKIRPMKLSSHLEKPQVLSPLLDLEEEEEEEREEIMSGTRGRDMRVVRDKSMRRRTRSLSPLRSTSLKWNDIESTFESDDVNKGSASCIDNNKGSNKKEILDHTKTTTAAEAATAEAEAASLSASTSRSSSAGRSTSKRWVFLKDFLYRSKSEGRSNNKFWSTISFSPINKDKKLPTTSSSSSNPSNTSIKNKPVNGIAGKRRGPAPSPHELHYTAKRAQAEELRKKTFLPYRQGLLGCLGFSSKGYGAMNGFARALNPVSSR